jgi:large subunit ribosomal protein L10
MERTEKERVVEELTERLQAAESLIVADYRGLTNAQIAELRVELTGHGARFVVVKNTLTRRAAEAAGADALLALLEGPTAIAFVEAEGDPAAVAKALAKSAKDTKVLALRGGVLSGEAMSAADIETLATLPALDVLQAQVVGVIVAPLTQLVAVLSAPLQNLVGLIDARIDQLGGAGVADEPEAVADEPETTDADAGDGGEDGDPTEPQDAEPVDSAEPQDAAAPAVDDGPPAEPEGSKATTGTQTDEDTESNDDQADAAPAEPADEEE